MNILEDDDFFEFMDHVEDELFENVPRVIRDVQNPLEKYTETQFLKRYRFTKDVVRMQILPMVTEMPSEPLSNRGMPLNPIIKLSIALRFYATGSYQVVCGDLCNISQSSVCRIIREVSEKIAGYLPHYIKFPATQAQKDQTKVDFYNMKGFPNVLGCIDCVHVPIVSPGGASAETFRNRKSWMSLNVQVISGPELQIFDIVIRWPGSTHDSRIFNNSSVKMRLEEGDLKGSFILGDSGYSQTKYLYTKVIEPTTEKEQRYNQALIPTRTSVERTFGVLKRRFPCLCNRLRNKLRTTIRIIAACAVLHNIGRIWDPRDFPMEMNQVEWENLVVDAPEVRETIRGRVIKQRFIERNF